jgi:hypothetical protein
MAPRSRAFLMIQARIARIDKGLTPSYLSLIITGPLPVGACCGVTPKPQKAPDFMFYEGKTQAIAKLPHDARNFMSTRGAGAADRNGVGATAPERNS